MSNLLISQKPVTLEESFRCIERTGVSIDRSAVMDFLLDFAAQVARVEEVDIRNPKNKGFIEFVMRNCMMVYADRIVRDSKRMADPSNVRWDPPNGEDLVPTYLKTMQNRYAHYVFEKARDEKILEYTA